MEPQKRWTKIDRSDLGLLAALYSVPCFYYLIHTDEGFEVPSNQKIINFKIKLEDIEKTPSRAYWKNMAIDELSSELACWLNDVSESLKQWGNVALVPMPTSRPQSHRYYDSRLVQLCEKAARINGLVRVENIFDLKQTLKPSHEGGPRDVPTLKSNIIVSQPEYPLNVVILVDDLLTSGSHFTASTMALTEQFPDVAIVGLFLARHRYV